MSPTSRLRVLRGACAFLREHDSVTDGTLPAVTLVVGGAASGKSAYAESLVGESGLRQIYIATAEETDDEMAARIADHRARRSAAWTTIEAPLELAAALQANARTGNAVLIDCLTVWLGNLVMCKRDAGAETAALVTALGAVRGPAVVISNEIGYGIVPDNPLSRRFRDLHGTLNQAVAGVADRVVLVAAGLPLALKGDES